jgi:RNA exonuclease 1
VLFQHSRGPPFKPSLKWLAERWLKKKIQMPNEIAVPGQEGVVIGHDSQEDAQTAMELLDLKMKEGAFNAIATLRS